MMDTEYIEDFAEVNEDLYEDNIEQLVSSLLVTIDIQYSLTNGTDSLALESFGSDLLFKTKALLSALGDKFTNIAFSKKNIIPDLIPLTKVAKQDFSFNIASDKLMVVSTGFSGNYTDYGNDLLSVAKLVYPISLRYLESFNRYVGAIANKPNSLSNIQPSEVYNDYLSQIPVNTRKVYYSEKYPKPAYPLNKLVSSKKDLLDLADIFTELRSILLKVDLLYYQRLIKELDYKFKSIISYYSNSKDELNLNRVQLVILADSAKIVGDWVSYIALFQYEIMAYLNSIQELYNSINSEYK